MQNICYNSNLNTQEINIKSKDKKILKGAST